ncbi:hypothetical protein [Elongatibacter sediminis]|uniref:Peptidase M61 catalytic domain-containing protein n=1 Tax=Elongatibacter sediminis TaxID=3119006 RepID=A0AAW9RCH0_9GAMM
MRFLLPTLLALFATTTVAAEDRYRVTLEPAWRDGPAAVSVEVCFDGDPPHELHRSSAAAAFTIRITGPGGPILNHDRHGRLRLGELPDNACVSWQVDLARAAAEGDSRLALNAAGAVVSDGDLWFWRDGDRRRVRVDVSAPPGVRFSTPWPEIAAPEKLPPAANTTRRFAPEPTSAWWTSRIAIGRFHERRLAVPGGHLRLAVLGVDHASDVDRYAAWIRETALSVASVTGAFPQKNPQVLIITLGPQGEPVPWAHVIRGGGVAAELFVDRSASLDTLRADWTATHELSHLLLPYVTRRDRWLSEGLASYYQNVLRARDGRLDEQRAWEKLNSGFKRGERATRGGTLASATRAGRSATMRIYWSGAAMMLKADARLRALSNGRQSLDTALAALHECCHDPTRRWSAHELFTRLDRLTGHRVFADLYDEHVMDEAFPDVSETYRRLGVVPGWRGLRLEPDAPWSRIRHFIMNTPGMNTQEPGAPADPHRERASEGP